MFKSLTSLSGRFKTFVRRPIGIATVVVVLIIVVWALRSSNSNQDDKNFAVVKRGSITQEVSVTGRVKAAQNVSLAFEKPGRIAQVLVNVGDHVYAGQTLVTLANADLAADLVQAEANVKTEQAKLDQLKRGARPEEIEIAETEKNNAQAALGDAKNNLVDKIQDAYTKSDDAVRTKADQLFTNPRSTNPQLVFTADSQVMTDLLTQRISIEKMLTKWGVSASIASADTVSLNQSGETRNNLQQIKIFLDTCAFAVNNLSASANISATTLSGWKTDLNTARTNVNTAISNLSAAEEKFRTADSALKIASQQLDLKKAGSTAEDIAAQTAQVERAMATVQNTRAQIAKTVLYAPINGIITKQDAKVGELSSSNVALVAMISESEFEIEASMPEGDIAKVKLGDDAAVTLDAYQDATFDARVVKIDPAETLVQGVVTYKTTLQFTQKDDRIRSGMTANVVIKTDKKDNVLVIPQRAVTSKEGKKYVRIVRPKNALEEIEVQLGARGAQGDVEVVGGLQEGDTISTLSVTQ